MAWRRPSWPISNFPWSPQEKAQLPSILEHTLHPRSFHEHRQRAIEAPHRARDTLSGYAVLELKIIKARSLLANDNYGTMNSSDPYAEVYIDDIFKAKTHQVDMSLNPVWNWQTTFEMKNPASIVLLRVLDFQVVLDHELLGFVEFPIADMPLNQTICGWFVLSPAGELKGTATERLESKLTDRVAETCGAVQIEATLRIASAGCESDELYAWCLPPPAFREYDEKGYRKSLDSQGMMDKIQAIKTYCFYFIRPLLAFIHIVLHWEDLAMSSTVFFAVICVCVYPFLLLTGVLIMLGVLLLLLSSAHRRKRICAHPSFVPLNDEGYELIAALQETEALYAFLTRVVVTSMRGKILDVDRFREFAAFIALGGKPATRFVDLKDQVLQASNIDNPFLTCDHLRSAGLPLAPGSLVKVGASENGEIIKCVNPQEPLAWRYEVVFPHPHEQSVCREIPGDDLETRTDLRWMQTQAVLALIPDSVEDTIESFHPTLDSTMRSLKRNYETIAGILSWNSPGFCSKVALGCIALGILCIWLQRVLMTTATLYVFASGLHHWASHSRWRAASSKARQHSTKKFETWGFLDGGHRLLRRDIKGQVAQEEFEEPYERVGFLEALTCCAKHK